MNNVRREKTQKLVLCALLTALVIILQFMGAFVKLGPFSVSLVLIPIVIGAATCSVWASAWLGFIFGVIVLVTDAGAFLAVSVPGTIATVLVKGIGCGIAAGLVYKLFERFNRYAATVAAAVVCPIVNTGLFLIGCRIFFMDTIAQWAVAAGAQGNVASYMIFTMVGVNFLAELISNIVLSPIVVRILNIRNKSAA